MKFQPKLCARFRNFFFYDWSVRQIKRWHCTQRSSPACLVALKQMVNKVYMILTIVATNVLCWYNGPPLYQICIPKLRYSSGVSHILLLNLLVANTWYTLRLIFLKWQLVCKFGVSLEINFLSNICISSPFCTAPLFGVLFFLSLSRFYSEITFSYEELCTATSIRRGFDFSYWMYHELM